MGAPEVKYYQPEELANIADGVLKRLNTLSKEEQLNTLQYMVEFLSGQLKRLSPVFKSMIAIIVKVNGIVGGVDSELMKVFTNDIIKE
jgi:hypothetical protein